MRFFVKNDVFGKPSAGPNLFEPCRGKKTTVAKRTTFYGKDTGLKPHARNRTTGNTECTTHWTVGRGEESDGSSHKKIAAKAALRTASAVGTDGTNSISRSARRVRGSRMPPFTEKKIRASRHRQDPPHRPTRGRYRSARSAPRRRRRTRGCTSVRMCAEERSRHPVRWL